MNTPNPVDPDKLRARLTQAVEPVKPSPDALVRIKSGARKRRRLQWTIGSGAGVLAIAGATAAVVAVGSLGHPSALGRTVQPGYSPTVTSSTTTPPTATTPSPSATPATAVSAAPSAGVPAVESAIPAPLTSEPVTSAAAATTTGTPSTVTFSSVAATPVADDVDQDGTSDTAVVRPAGSKAQLVVHLAGRTVASAPFGFNTDAGVAKVWFISVNQDGRTEMMVTGLGASATPHYLFQYAKGQVTEVAPPSGLKDPWLVSGGGHNITIAFDCTPAGLVLSSASPTSLTNFDPNTDTSYVFKTAVYRFQGETLVKQGGQTRSGLTRAAGLALAAAEPSGRCGAPL